LNRRSAEWRQTISLAPSGPVGPVLICRRQQAAEVNNFGRDATDNGISEYARPIVYQLDIELVLDNVDYLGADAAKPRTGGKYEGRLADPRTELLLQSV